MQQYFLITLIYNFVTIVDYTSLLGFYTKKSVIFHDFTQTLSFKMSLKISIRYSTLLLLKASKT